MKNLFFTVIGISLFCLVLYFTSDQDKNWSYGVEIDQLTDQKTFYSNLTKKTDDNEFTLTFSCTKEAPFIFSIQNEKFLSEKGESFWIDYTIKHPKEKTTDIRNLKFLTYPYSENSGYTTIGEEHFLIEDIYYNPCDTSYNDPDYCSKLIIKIKTSNNEFITEDFSLINAHDSFMSVIEDCHNDK